MAAKKKAAKRKAAGKRELIDTGTNKLFARRTAREGGWAGRWSVVLDDDMEAKIRKVLPAKRTRARADQ